MNYIDFLKDLTPFIDKDRYYLLNGFAIFLVFASVSLSYFCYDSLKAFNKTKQPGYFALAQNYGAASVIGFIGFYVAVTLATNDIPKLKEVRIDNKENIEFYKTIIRSPYYQKMDKSDKEAVYASTFNGIVCDDKGCLSNTGDPLLAHKNFALTYAIQNALLDDNVKLRKYFGKNTLNDIVFQGLNGLSYNGISYDYKKAFEDFLEKTPKAVEEIENAKEAYKNLEATYGTEWK